MLFLFRVGEFGEGYDVVFKTFFIFIDCCFDFLSEFYFLVKFGFY